MKILMTLVALLMFSVSCSRNSDSPTDSGTGTGAPTREAFPAQGSGGR